MVTSSLNDLLTRVFPGVPHRPEISTPINQDSAWVVTAPRACWSRIKIMIIIIIVVDSNNIEIDNNNNNSSSSSSNNPHPQVCTSLMPDEGAVAEMMTLLPEGAGPIPHLFISYYYSLVITFYYYYYYYYSLCIIIYCYYSLFITIYWSSIIYPFSASESLGEQAARSPVRAGCAMCIYIYIYIYICLYMFIYIYIYRERERNLYDEGRQARKLRYLFRLGYISLTPALDNDISQEANAHISGSTCPIPPPCRAGSKDI